MTLDKVHLPPGLAFLKNVKLVQTSPEMPMFVLFHHHSRRSVVPQGDGVEGGSASSRSPGREGRATQDGRGGGCRAEQRGDGRQNRRGSAGVIQGMERHPGFLSDGLSPLLSCPLPATCVKSQAATASAPSPVQPWLGIYESPRGGVDPLVDLL